MSRYGHMVKFDGKYYMAGEEVPDSVCPHESPIVQPPKEAVQPIAEKVPVNTAVATERPQMKPIK